MLRTSAGNLSFDLRLFSRQTWILPRAERMETNDNLKQTNSVVSASASAVTDMLAMFDNVRNNMRRRHLIAFSHIRNQEDNQYFNKEKEL